MTNVYIAILRAVNKIIFPIISSCTAILINIYLNYVLILGEFSALVMGAPGVAVAILMTRMIEIALTLGYVCGKKLPVAYRLRELFDWSGLFIS